MDQYALESLADPFHRGALECRKASGTDLQPMLGTTAASPRQETGDVILSDQGPGCRIVRNAQRVRKSGSRVRLEESAAMRFARQVQLPVPVVHEVNPAGEGTEIIMDFVEGECLEETWLSMGADLKRSLALEIRDIVMTMRKTRSTCSTIGACGGPARDCRQFSDYSGGPFEKEEEFNNFLLDFTGRTPDILRRAISENLCTNSRIVFTHGDISPRNIIVKDGHVQALLDWEFSGWYPEYWEFVKFFERPTNCKDWKDHAEVIFDTTYSRELILFQALARWQKP